MLGWKKNLYYIIPLFSSENKRGTLVLGGHVSLHSRLIQLTCEFTVSIYSSNNCLSPSSWLTGCIPSMRPLLPPKLSFLVSVHVPPLCSFWAQLCGRSWKRSRWRAFERLSNWQRKFEEFIALVIKNSREKSCLH